MYRFVVIGGRILPFSRLENFSSENEPQHISCLEISTALKECLLHGDQDQIGREGPRVKTLFIYQQG